MSAQQAFGASGLDQGGTRSANQVDRVTSAGRLSSVGIRDAVSDVSNVNITRPIESIQAAHSAAAERPRVSVCVSPAVTDYISMPVYARPEPSLTKDGPFSPAVSKPLYSVAMPSVTEVDEGIFHVSTQSGNMQNWDLPGVVCPPRTNTYQYGAQYGNWPVSVFPSQLSQASGIGLQFDIEPPVAGFSSTAQGLTTTALTFQTLTAGTATAVTTRSVSGAMIQPLLFTTQGAVSAPAISGALPQPSGIFAAALSTVEPSIMPEVTSSGTVAAAPPGIIPAASTTAAAAGQMTTSSAAPMSTAGTASSTTSGNAATVVTPASGPVTSTSTSSATVPDEKPPRPPTSSTTAAVIATPAETVTTSSPAASVVVVRQHQPMRLYNGSTSWRLCRGIFQRLSKSTDGQQKTNNYNI